MMASILESYGRPDSSSSNSDVPTLGDLISCVEKWLPPVLRTATTTDKVKLFDAIATLYRKRDEHRQLVHEQYRRTVQTYYKARHPEIFLFQPEIFLAPSMLHMLQDGSEAAVRRTICAHGPLLYSFDMLQPRICSLILDEVENFERWLHHANMQKSPPNSLSSNGVVLDDFGLSPVLNMLVHHCIAPLVPEMLELSTCWLGLCHMAGLPSSASFRLLPCGSLVSTAREGPIGFPSWLCGEPLPKPGAINRVSC